MRLDGNRSGQTPDSNPFKPGAGRVPPELAGRHELVESVAEMLDQVLAESEGDRPLVISGLRGVGKTVLLNEFVRQTQASTRWLAIKIEAVVDSSLLQRLVQELYLELRKLASAGERARSLLGKALSVFRSFQLKVDPDGAYSFGFDVLPAAGTADSGHVEKDLVDLLETLGEALRGLDMGVLIAVDEFQNAPRSDLNAVNVALHEVGQRAWPVPVVFIGAGLPSLPAVLSDATSYAERLYDYRTLTLLTDAETEVALTRPCELRGVQWHTDALVLAVDTIAGYPYFAQSCGKHVWRVRKDASEITIEDVELGLVRARNEVDQGLYKSRWERATPAQRDLMRVMAADLDAPSTLSDLTARLNKAKSKELSVARAALIKSGHIYAPDRGMLAFTVPGMASYINHRAAT